MTERIDTPCGVGTCDQWRRHHGARGARAPHFSEWLGTGGHRERTLTGRKLQVEPADRPGDMCHDNPVIQ